MGIQGKIDDMLQEAVAHQRKLRQIELDQAQRQRGAVRDAADHQARLRAVELEVAALQLERAKVELHIQSIIETHVADVEKAARFSSWGRGGASS